MFSNKAYRNAIEQMLIGNQNLVLHRVNQGIPQVLFCRKIITPGLFLFHWDAQEAGIFKVYYGRKPITVDDSQNDTYVEALFDGHSQKGHVLHMRSEELEATYRSVDRTGLESCRVFQENSLFSDLTLCDSKTGLNPIRISCTGAEDRLVLRTVALSYLDTLHSGLINAISAYEQLTVAQGDR